MKIQRIDHMHIVVKDLDAACKRMSEIFGVTCFGPKEPEGPGRFKVAFDDLGIEYLQPVAEGNFIDDHLKQYGEGAAWIGIKVENLNEAVNELRAKGISIEIRTPTDPSYTGDMHVASTTDPSQTCGAVFELMEYKDAQPACMGNWNKVGELPKLSTP